MQESTNREKVLKKIRAALLHKTPNPHPNLDSEKIVFAISDAPAELVFAEKFQALGGLLVICENNEEIIETLAAISKENNWTEVFCIDKNISSLLDEINFSHQSIFDAEEDKHVQAAILNAEALIANTGITVINIGKEHGRHLPAIAENLLIICDAAKICDDLKTFLATTKATYNGSHPSGFYFISPAATKIMLPSGDKASSAIFKKMYVVMLMNDGEFQS
jgi:L-lactate dehydrogenase complex protein LldG